MAEKIARIVKSDLFQASILVLILLAAVLVGLETFPTLNARYGELFSLLNQLILWAFVAEAVFKMAQHGRHFLRYFRDPWNVFDFLIIVVCFLPVNAGYAAVFRMARVVRALRLVTALPKLQLIVNCLLKSIPAMFYVGVLLTLTFYVYAVLGVFFFRENDPVHFRDLPTSLLSLFRVVTLEDWTDVMYIQMLGSDVYSYSNTTGIVPKPKAQPLLSVTFFVSFVFLGTMIMLNLFIGVILSSMTEAQDEADRGNLDMEKAANEQLSLVSEVQSIELQLDDLKQHLHMLRLRLGNESADLLGKEQERSS